MGDLLVKKSTSMEAFWPRIRGQGPFGPVEQPLTLTCSSFASACWPTEQSVREILLASATFKLASAKSVTVKPIRFELRNGGMIFGDTN